MDIDNSDGDLYTEIVIKEEEIETVDHAILLESEPSSVGGSLLPSNETEINSGCSVQCPSCCTWNSIRAQKCINEDCDRYLREETEQQDVNNTSTNLETPVQRRKSGPYRNCPQCGTPNGFRALTCKNIDCKFALKAKSSQNPQVSSDPRKSQRVHIKECNTTVVWTKREKELFIHAVEKYGVIDLKKLCEAVVTKSRENIKSFIIQCCKSARANLVKSISEGLSHECKRKSNKVLSVKAPIDGWLTIMENAQPARHNDLKNLPIARGILYIAKYEPQPNPVQCGGIDFKSLYEVLYSVLCGLPPKKLNAATAKFMLDTFEYVITKSHSLRFKDKCEFLEGVTKASYEPCIKPRQYRNKRSVDNRDGFSLLELPGMNPLQVYRSLYEVAGRSSQINR